MRHLIDTRRPELIDVIQRFSIMIDMAIFHVSAEAENDAKGLVTTYVITKIMKWQG